MFPEGKGAPGDRGRLWRMWPQPSHGPGRLEVTWSLAGWGSLTCAVCSEADSALQLCWKTHKACGGQRVGLTASLLEAVGWGR